MNRLWYIALAALAAMVACALFFAFDHAAPQPATAPASQKILWGAYVGADDTALASFETLVGAPADLQAVFVGWGASGSFPAWLDPLAASGKTLVIFWEPSGGNSDDAAQPAYNYDSILHGAWDSYFASFAARTHAYGGPIILVPFEEMNGDWYPWSGTKNGNTPAKAIAAFRYVHAFFADAPNVRFGWAPNAISEPDTLANAIDAYYPGGAYVDYVGLDGFNFGGADEQSFGQIFNSALAQLQQYKKPVFIFSMATAEELAKAAWITDALTVHIPRDHIAGWIWFNQNKERPWAIDSDAAALAAFRAAVR